MFYDNASSYSYVHIGLYIAIFVTLSIFTIWVSMPTRNISVVTQTQIENSTISKESSAEFALSRVVTGAIDDEKLLNDMRKRITIPSL